MRLISQHHYGVNPGEQVSIRVSLAGVGSASLSVILDGGQPLTPAGSGEYAFPVTEPPGGAHVCLIAAHFLPGAGDDAAAQVEVAGQGGLVSESFSLRGQDWSREATLRFEVEDDLSSSAEPEAPDEADPPIIIGEADGITPPRPW